jgi:hypothetical protein
LLRDLIYAESYSHLIAFEWLVEKQELRESKEVAHSSSVVKDKMAADFAGNRRKNYFRINLTPIPVI